MLRYQIADFIVDFFHVFWVGFLLVPEGRVAMGSATIFGPVRDLFPPYVLPALMVVLAATPTVAARRDWPSLYVAARCCSAVFFAYLGVLCARAHPVSTGVVYFIIAVACLALLRVALRPHGDWQAGE